MLYYIMPLTIGITPIISYCNINDILLYHTVYNQFGIYLSLLLTLDSLTPYAIIYIVQVFTSPVISARARVRVPVCVCARVCVTLLMMEDGVDVLEDDSVSECFVSSEGGGIGGRCHSTSFHRPDSAI